MSNPKTSKKKKDSSKKIKSAPIRIPKTFYWIIILSAFIVVLLFILVQIAFINRIFFVILIAGINVGGLTPNETEKTLPALLANKVSPKISFHINQDGVNQTVDIDTGALIKEIDYQPSIRQAFFLGHSQFFFPP